MFRTIIGLVALTLAAAPLAAAAQARTASDGWIGAWEASPQAQPAPLKPLKNQTVRQKARVAIGGARLRVVLSNAYGTRPLVIDAASVARMTGGAVDPKAIRPLTFAGSTSIVIPAGAPALSDPVDLPVEAMSELSVSLHLPNETLPETWHRGIPVQDAAGGAAPPEAIVSPPGDFTLAATIAGATPGGRLFVSRIDVLAPQATGAVVVIGTTRTDGDGRWPERLARRLQAAGRRTSVVNASMIANPLTRPYPGGGEAGLARFDRDVLGVPGVTHVIVADAINDIGQTGTMRDGQYLVRPEDGPTIDSLAAAYRQLVARAHARGVKLIAATLPPFEGVPFAGFYSPEKEKLRSDLNLWIRTSGAFDGVIDLDAMLRDPAHPTKFTPGLVTANNFAPNEAGEKKLVEAIDLGLFR
jgi:lysophospholipase L1-like esterase